MADIHKHFGSIDAKHDSNFYTDDPATVQEINRNLEDMASTYETISNAMELCIVRAVPRPKTLGDLMDLADDKINVTAIQACPQCVQNVAILLHEFAETLDAVASRMIVLRGQGHVRHKD